MFRRLFTNGICLNVVKLPNCFDYSQTITEQEMEFSQAEEILVEETEPNDEDEPQNIRYEITSFPTDFTVQVMYEKW